MEGHPVYIANDIESNHIKQEENVMNCPKCGRENTEYSKFCVQCGSQLSAEVQNETAPVPPSMPPQTVPQGNYMPYQPPMPPQKRFPAWLIVLIVIGALVVLAVLGTIGFIVGGSINSPSTESTASAASTVIEDDESITESKADNKTPVFEPIVLKGSGDKVISDVNIPEGSVYVKMTHSGSRNFIVKFHYGSGEYDYQLLSNAIGNYQGDCALSDKGKDAVENGTLEVKADGSWTVEFLPVTGTDSTKLSGKGDTVTKLITPPSALTKVKLTHDGERNFIVKIYAYNGSKYEYNLLANQIGAYSGETVATLNTGKQYYIQIKADGNWTIDLE